MNQPLLYDLYNELRSYKNWVNPGLEEYYLVLQLIESGRYPIQSFDEMAYVLETVWLKSQQHRHKFRQLLLARKQMLIEVAKSMKEEIEALSKEKKDAEEQKEIPAGGSTGGNNTSPLNAGGDAGKNERPGGTEITPSSQPLPGDKEESDEPSIEFSISNEQAGESKMVRLKLQEEVEKTIHNMPFLFNSDYFPVQTRHLQQAWRLLKSRQEGADAKEISLARTIEQTAKQGYFCGFHYEKEFLNQLRLFLFLDQGESMIAVEEFGKHLYLAAKEGELHKTLEPWYFQQLPEQDEQTGDYSFINEDWTQTASLRKLFAKLNKRDIVVMIYSDAGALNNEWDPERIRNTQAFLRRLNSITAYVAWINPAPKERWKNTNAGEIESIVPMFETTRTDIENAISILKGKQTR
jgi:uncharacterized protein with von Willebrand factor type A (vWA) domain